MIFKVLIVAVCLIHEFFILLKELLSYLLVLMSLIILYFLCFLYSLHLTWRSCLGWSFEFVHLGALDVIDLFKVCYLVILRGGFDRRTSVFHCLFWTFVFSKQTAFTGVVSWAFLKASWNFSFFNNIFLCYNCILLIVLTILDVDNFVLVKSWSFWCLEPFHISICLLLLVMIINFCFIITPTK